MTDVAQIPLPAAACPAPAMHELSATVMKDGVPPPPPVAPAAQHLSAAHTYHAPITTSSRDAAHVSDQ